MLPNKRCAMRYAILLLLTGCALPEFVTGPRPECVTKCDIRLFGPMPAPLDYDYPKDEPWTCESLQRAEDEMLRVFADASIPINERTKNIKDNPCSRMGFNLYIASQPTFIDAMRRKVAGTTSCDFKTMTIGNYSWRRTSLLHETMHILQDCMWPVNDEHRFWKEDGLEALEAAWLTAGRSAND